MKILIPIETSSRELLYKIYLCNILSSQGFDCYLGSKSEISFLIERFTNFIYLDKGFHKGVSELIHEKILKSKGIIVSLDEEGAVDFEDGSTLKVRYSSKLFEAAKLVFFWGDYQSQLIKDDIKTKSRFVVSGHPRFELLKREFHFLYDYDLDCIKKKYKKFILINTNMGFGNNIRGDAFVLENYVDRFKDIEKIIKNDKLKIKYFNSLINKLSELDYNIVVRPHPEEDFSLYIDEFSLKKNVFVVNENSVIPWIISCETMIHADCTTGIESLMLGKKPISYIPNELNNDYLTSFPIKASELLVNETDVVNYIKDGKYKTEVVFSEYDWLKDNFNYPENSFNIISNELNLLLNNSKIKSNYLSSFEIFAKNLKNFIKILFIGKDKLIYHKNKDFNYTNVNRIHYKILNSNPRFEGNTLEKIFNKLYVFRNEKY